MVKIEAVTIKDLEEITNLEIQELGQTLGIDTFKQFLNTSLIYLLKATIGEKIVGYISANILDGEGEILNFCVDANYKRSGIGTKLFNELVEVAHAKILTLEVKETNLVAIAFYLKQGFSIIAKRKNYYEGSINALVMKKEYI